MKKFLTFILTITIALSGFCFTSVNTAAAEVDVEYALACKAEILIDLGILSEEVTPETEITRLMFLRSMSRIMNDAEISDEMAFEVAKAMGATSAENIAAFDGETVIKYNEAVKMLVAVVGYGTLAEIDGGYPLGYLKAARTARIVDSLGADGNAALTYQNAVELLYKTIEATKQKEISYNIENGNGDYNVKYSADGESVIYFYRKLSKITGILDGNSITSLSDPNKSSKNRIFVDGTSYKCMIDRADNLLGYPVIAYCDRDGEIKAITVNAKNTETVMVYEKDIIGADKDVTSFTYRDEKEKEVKLKLSNVMDVVYNGKSLPSYDKSDLEPKDGSVKFIDNDGDEVFDVAFVTVTQLFFVRYTSSKTKMIYNQYDENLLEFLDLDSDNVIYNFTKDGEKIGINSIKRNDVLEVYISKSGDDVLVTGMVSRNTVKGTIDSISEDGKVVIASNATNAEDAEPTYSEYELSPRYLTEMGGTSEIKMDAFATIYLDSRNRIAAFDFSGGDEFYGYITAIGNKTTLGSVQIKYLSEDGKWYISDLADNVNYNLTYIKENSVYGKLGGDNFTRKVARLKLNSNGEVAMILLAGIITEGDSKFVEGEVMSGHWYPQNYSIGWNVYFSTDTTIFLVPEEADAQDDDYEVIKPGSLSGTYTLKPYNVNDFKCAEFAVVNNPMKEGAGEQASWFLVTDISPVLSPDGDKTIRIYSKFGKDESNTIIGKDYSVFENVHPGDLISFVVDNNGRARSVTKIHDINDGKVLSPLDTYHAVAAVSKGVLLDVDVENNKLLIDQGNEVVANVPAGRILRIFDAQTKIMTKGTIADLKAEDYIIMRYVWSDYSDMVVIRY